MLGRGALLLSQLVSILTMHDMLIMRMSRRGVVYLASGFAVANIGNTLLPNSATIQLVIAIVINTLLVVVGALTWNLVVLRTAKILARADDRLGAILSDVEAQQLSQRDTR